MANKRPVRKRRRGPTIPKTLLQSKGWDYFAHTLAISVGLGFYFAGVPILGALVWLGLYIVLGIVLPLNEHSKLFKQAHVKWRAQQLADPRTAVLIDVDAQLKKLTRAINRFPDELAETGEAIYNHTVNIINAVDADASQAVRMSRFFSTDLPNVIQLAKDRATVEQRQNAELLVTIDETLLGYRKLFADTERSLMDPKLEAVAMDIKLLLDSINAEQVSPRT